MGAGYRSQKVFAHEIGVSESSVAYAESGSDRSGDVVFAAIENGLGWPADIIRQYLDSGDESLLDSMVTQAEMTPEPTAPVQFAEVDRSPPEDEPGVQAQLGLIYQDVTRMLDRVTAEIESREQGQRGDPVAFNALVRDAETLLERAQTLREQDKTP